MKNLSYKLSLFSVLALVAFEPQKLQATSSSSSSEEIQNSQKPVKSLTSESFDLIQNKLLKIKNDCLYHFESHSNCYGDFLIEEMKQFESFMTPDNDLFDSWITLILAEYYSEDFILSLEGAKAKGESKLAMPAAQYNLGYMYQYGKSVHRNLAKAFELYEAAADQGYVIAQINLGKMYHVSKNLSEAFKWFKKASEQNHPIAHFFLADVYHYGKGTHQDLLHSLQYYLEAGKKIKTHLKIHKIMEKLVTFTPTTFSLNDEKHYLNNQETFTNDIEAFLRRHGMEKDINTPYDSEKGSDKLTLSYKESKFAIPSLFKNYSEIVDFEEFLLKSISTFVQSGFMVTCLQPNDVKAFKSSTCPDIKYYELQGQSFLIFGQDNIKAADKWMTIFDPARPIYSAISDVLSVLEEIHKNHYTKIQMSDPAKTLKTQYEFRLKLDLDKTSKSDETSDLTLNKALITKVEQDIEVLTQLQAIPQQLTDLLIEGASVRNRLFLQNNDYIEPIFKD